MGNMIGVKLVSGDDVIGFLEKKSWLGDYTIRKPMRLMFFPDNSITLQPYIVYAMTDQLTFKRKDILCAYPITDMMIQVFETVWGSMQEIITHGLAVNAAKATGQNKPAPTANVAAMTLVQPVDQGIMN